MQRSWFLALPAHFKSPEDLIKITETSPTSRNSNSFGLQMSCASVLKTSQGFPQWSSDQDSALQWRGRWFYLRSHMLQGALKFFLINK